MSAARKDFVLIVIIVALATAVSILIAARSL